MALAAALYALWYRPLRLNVSWAVASMLRKTEQPAVALTRSAATPQAMKVERILDRERTEGIEHPKPARVNLSYPAIVQWATERERRAVISPYRIAPDW